MAAVTPDRRIKLLIQTKLALLLLLVVSASVFASKVDTLVIMSTAMSKEIKNVVILPDRYDKSQKSFAVLYLLHGAYGSYKSWPTNMSAVNDYADKYNMIVVCPDGGRTSWYFDSPVDNQMKYETYITSELIAEIDKTYNTRQDSAGRAITGLSMGGHGAFYLAFKHQDIWGAAGSTSGGVDIRPFPNGWDLPLRLGSYTEFPQNWEKNSVINMVYLLDGKKLQLIFDCGVDDFFYDANLRLHDRLLERNIPHDYIERPGGHTLDYWINSIEYQFLFFHNFFEMTKSVEAEK